MRDLKLQQRILVVDDTRTIRDLVSAILSKFADITMAESGEAAMQLLDDGQTFDLILLDVRMPGMSGYEVMESINKHPLSNATPVIFLTSHDDHEAEERALNLGAVDFIAKPFSAPILRARVFNHLALKEARDLIEAQNETLEETVRARTAELVLTQDVTILSLASLAETRDNETGMHIRRTQSYVRLLADELRARGHYTDLLNDDTIKLMEKSAPLHDIGKVGIPDAVLLKPGKLTPEEFEIIKDHPTLGKNALEGAENMLGSTSFLRFAKEIAYSHHEKWNGSGYPQGLAGQDIPLSARLMAVADVYDALIARRVYKSAFTHETAIDLIVEGKGTHFDPVVVEVFLTLIDEFNKTALKFKD